jgi:hypothetical protein
LQKIEVRRILNRAVNQNDETGLGTFISEQFQAIGGIELEIPSGLWLMA